jgi:hypothetical protein
VAVRRKMVKHSDLKAYDGCGDKYPRVLSPFGFGLGNN